MSRRYFSGMQVAALCALIALFAYAPTASSQIVFDNFDDGDVSDIGSFSGGAMGIGVGVGPTTGVSGAENTGLSVGINPGAGGGFAGFVIPGGDGVTDISGADFLVFSFRATTVQSGNLPLTLEINLQEDTNGNGTYEGATEDEYQAVYNVTPGTDYVTVQIPIEAFGDDNSVNPGANDGFDYTKLLQIVGAFGGIQGPEFRFAIDEVGFAVGTATSAPRLPEVFGAAPSVFPNPAADRATLAFELSAPSAATIDLVDVLGRSVLVVSQGMRSAGPVSLSVPTSDLAPGLYFVRVATDSGVATTSLTVVR